MMELNIATINEDMQLIENCIEEYKKCNENSICPHCQLWNLALKHDIQYKIREDVKVYNYYVENEKFKNKTPSCSALIEILIKIYTMNKL